MSLRTNSPRVIFLLGRPCSGKTSAIYILRDALQSLGVDNSKIAIYNDYTLLRKRFLNDKNRQDFEDGPRGGFKVKNFGVLDTSLREINNEVLYDLNNKSFVFVEFSRNKYILALKNFNHYLLGICTIVYINASLDVCLRRNSERFSFANDESGYVPIDILQTYYREDDSNLLDEFYPGCLIQIENNQEKLSLLKSALFEKFYYIVR